MPAPKTEATARPWHVSQVHTQCNGTASVFGDGHYIALVNPLPLTANLPEWRDTPEPLAAANARLIVRAVNSHAALLAALKELLTAAEIVDGSETPSDDDTAHLLASFEKARAAIAAAEGE